MRINKQTQSAYSTAYVLSSLVLEKIHAARLTPQVACFGILRAVPDLTNQDWDVLCDMLSFNIPQWWEASSFAERMASNKITSEIKFDLLSILLADNGEL